METLELTLLLFGAALVIGVIAFRRTAALGGASPLIVRLGLRLTFGVCVFLAAWACTSFALWASGVELKIGTIAAGRMGETWWLGPFCIVWAVLAYVSLRRSSR